MNIDYFWSFMDNAWNMKGTQTLDTQIELKPFNIKTVSNPNLNLSADS